MNRKEWSKRKGRSSNWIPSSVRYSIYHRDGFRCVHCRKRAPPFTGVGLTLDHVKPRIVGGDDHYTNLVTACVKCNSSRQGREHSKRKLASLRKHTDKALNFEVGRVMMRLRKFAMQKMWPVQETE